MKKTDWPIRWDLLLRYRLIEIIALWEGRLTTNHLSHHFGIGRQQASKDINTYLRQLAPDNLGYDPHLKGYVPTSGFRPRVTRGCVEEYRELLWRQDDLSQTFTSLDIGLPGYTSLRAPLRKIAPEVMRVVVAAIRQRRRLKARYASLAQPRPCERLLEPHTLICHTHNWHLRAWCDTSSDFRDFALSRFQGGPELLNQKARHGREQDREWHQQVSLTIRPDQRLSPAQQTIVATDYAMADEQMTVATRTALVPHLLAQFCLGEGQRHPDPMIQQLELVGVTPLESGDDRDAAVSEARGLC